MPGLVHSRGVGIVFSIDRHLDVFSPPKKKSRIFGPLTVARKLKDKRPTLDMLPDECLFEIFIRLPSPCERSISACVSRRWLTILSGIRLNEFIWKQHVVNFDETILKDEDLLEEDIEEESDGCLSRSVESKKAADVRLAAIAVATVSRGGLGKLSIRGSNSFFGVSDHGLAAIARGCPFLKDLSIWSVPSVSDQGLFEIARECRLLEKLDLCQLSSISDTSLSLIAENCPNLKSLTIESCPNVGDLSLQAVAKLCPKLNSVTIIDCPLVGDRGVSTLMLSACAVLARLKLQGVGITDYSVAVIGCYGKAITHLALSGLPSVRQRSLWAMAKAKGLESLLSLTITSCNGMGDLSLEAVGRDIPNLKHLSISKNCSVSDIGLVSFVKAASCLESLQLEECSRITQTGILMALSSSNSKLKSFTLVKCMGIKEKDDGGLSEIPYLSPCKSLRCISIRNCSGVGDTTLGIIGRICPQLHSLDLTGLRSITDDGLVSFLLWCEAGVSKLSVSNCSNLSDELILNLCKLHGRTLKLLNLNGCRKITDTSLAAIAENCPLLNDLDLSKCSITDVGVAALSNRVELNLQILSLSGCPMISNGSFPALEKLGKKLIGLNLQSCSSLSPALIDLLSENLWKCDLLY